RTRCRLEGGPAGPGLDTRLHAALPEGGAHPLEVTEQEQPLRLQDLDLPLEHDRALGMALGVLGGDAGGLRVANLDRESLAPAAHRFLVPLGLGVPTRRGQLGIEATQRFSRRPLVTTHGARRRVAGLVLQLTLKIRDRFAPRLLPVLEHATKL